MKAPKRSAPRKKKEPHPQEQPTVFITNRVHPEVLAFLGQFARVKSNPNIEPFSRERFFKEASRASALMVFMNDTLDAAALKQCPQLRIVAAALKGCDNFDVAACTARGVWFTIVPDLLTNPTAELAIALALGISRKVLEGDRIVRSGAYGGWRPILYGTGLHGRTAGIVGMGKLGRALASRLSAFGMKILYTDPVALPGAMETDLGATPHEACRTSRGERLRLLAIAPDARDFSSLWLRDARPDETRRLSDQHWPRFHR